MFDIDYRKAKRQDCRRLAVLDNIASGGAIDYLFSDLVPDTSPIQVVAFFLDNEKDAYSFQNAIVAEKDRMVIGMALSFPSKFHTITREMEDFLPPDRMERFREFFSTRVEDSYYLDALGVDENCRNAGVGSRLIELTRQKAVDEGFDMLSLIVFADNLGAQRLYQRHGFEIVRHIELRPHARIPHEGGCYLMKAAI